MTLIPFILLLVAIVLAYMINRHAAVQLRADGQRLHSLPSQHGMLAALSVLVPVTVLILVWLALQGPVIDWLTMTSLPDEALAGVEVGAQTLVLSEIKSVAGGRVFGEPEAWKLEAADRLVAMRGLSGWLLVAVTALMSAVILFVRRRQVVASMRARQRAERIVLGLMVFCSVVAVLTTVGIVASLLFETMKFLQKVPLTEFLFGLNWEPQIPMREDQVAAEGAFGWLPVMLGTLVIMTVALVLAVPTGLFAAIYLNEFASKSVRATAKPLLEILAGVPTVVYGFFAILVVAPAIRSAGASLGISVSPNTALAAGGVMGVMLIPFISSFADDALSAVPRSLRDGALALGSTRGETMMKVLFPAAIPGIVGGVLLAVSRAIGETMIVVMAAGLIAKLTINPLESVTTVTVQIVTLLIGDTSFDNPKTLAAFALGLMLFLVTLVINVFAIRIVRKYREAYD